MSDRSFVLMREGGRRFRASDAAPRRLNLQILLIALLVIAGFVYFERIVGLVPCELCLKERLPWYAALGLSLLFLVWHPRPMLRGLPLVFGILFLISATLATYHVLVEQHIIAGPTACTSSSVPGESVEALKQRILSTAPVRCDEVQWRLIGVSLAGWNVAASLFVVGLAALAMNRRN